jgi:hypothetical protein
MTPHTYRRNTWTLIVIGGFIAIMILSCKKERSFPPEPRHGDHSIREWIKKHTFVDTVVNNKN